MVPASGKGAGGRSARRKKRSPSKNSDAENFTEPSPPPPPPPTAVGPSGDRSTRRLLRSRTEKINPTQSIISPTRPGHISVIFFRICPLQSIFCIPGA